MASPTPNKGYTYPAHGGAVNAWDAPLNTNFDTIDKNFGGSITIPLTTGATVLSNSDAQNAIYIFTGALVGNCTVQWPAVGGTYVIDNQTTGAFSVTLQNAGGGTTVVALQGKRTEIFSSGNDMKTVVNAADGDWYVPGDLDVDGIITTPEIDVDTVKSTNPYEQGGIPLVLGHGQCVFQIASSTTCTLFPKNGNTIAFPGGGILQLPSAGITATNGGLSNNTVYYVYVVLAGTLTASTTGHTTDPTTGIEVMIGDSTKVLVGMVYLVAGSFLDSGSTRLVASWFNRRLKSGSVSVSGTTASTTAVEINSPNSRVSFLSWGDSVFSGLSGWVAHSNNSLENVVTYLNLNGSNAFASSSILTNARVGGFNNVATLGVVTPAEGFNYITVFGQISADTATWLANNYLQVTS